MAVGGRKPKPTWLKEVAGNPGKRALPKNEPKLSVKIPRPPAGMSEEAKRHWKVVAKQLADAGVMTEIDRDALVLYCECWSRWWDALQDIRKNGPVSTTHNGYRVPSPYIAIANKAAEQMRHMLAEFGMTPSSRTRVTSTKKSKGEFDDF